MKRIILTLALILSPTFFANAAHAQGYAVYSIVQPEYRIGSFRVHPPAGDGWRQVSNSAKVLRLVYAEIVEGDTINTRADVVAESFPIATPEVVPNPLQLTLSGQTQQMEQRGDNLLGYTRIEKIEAPVETHAYTLKTRLTEEKNRYETFFVTLAPDKSEYMVVKLTSDEEEYNLQPYFTQFRESYAKLSHPTADDSAQAPADEEESGDAEDSSGDDAAAPE